MTTKPPKLCWRRLNVLKESAERRKRESSKHFNKSNSKKNKRCLHRRNKQDSRLRPSKKGKESCRKRQL